MLEKYGEGVVNAVSGGMKYGIDTTLTPAIKLVDSVKEAYALLGAKVTTDPALNTAANVVVRAVQSELPPGQPSVQTGLPSTPISDTVQKVFDASDIASALLQFLGRIVGK